MSEVGERLRLAREKSKRRKELLDCTLGSSWAEELGSESVKLKKLNEDSSKTSTESQSTCQDRLSTSKLTSDLSENTSSPAALASGNDDCPNRTEEFRDSTAFLKGTQSLNPHNDYSQNFVDTGQRPQNFIRDVGLADRFEEYPKLRELIRLKNKLVDEVAHPPMYLKCDLETFDFKSLDHKFDVILIEPPLEEYARSYGVNNVKFWDWDKIMALDISEVAAQRSFVFLWCGSSDGLDLGRLCLQHWGFRRCEDICWIQTNHKTGAAKMLEPNAAFQRTKEHCLMGIKGTVRRSTDGSFIHANVDIDLIIDEEPDPGSLEKPIEMFRIIEHFCLGTRRLHIFGRDTTIRPGWLTIGPMLTMSNYDQSLYKSYFEKGTVTACSERIENLRPKSPPAKSGRGRGSRGGRGSGDSRGRGSGGSRGRGERSSR